MATEIVGQTSQTQDYLSSRPRIRIADLAEAKRLGQKWVMLTSYDAVSARIFDHAKIPCLLIGDSGGQTVLGYKSTIPVTMDEMIIMAKAVSSGSKRSLIICDMPFGSYEESPQVALRNASRLMKEAGVHGIKIEGGKEYVEHVKLLTRAGIPVMGHIGFTPQSEHVLSGFKVQGRCEGGTTLLDDAQCLEEAGVFACVIELVPSEIGRLLSEQVEIPIIGIGAGPHCDAQVLVWHDMAGFSAPKDSDATSYLVSKENDTKSQSTSSGSRELELARVPKFVKRYANISNILYKAAIDYAEDVKNGKFPAEEHCYK